MATLFALAHTLKAATMGLIMRNGKTCHQTHWNRQTARYITKGQAIMNTVKFLTMLLFTLLATVGFAAVTAPQVGVVRASATGDTISSSYIPIGAKISSIKVNPQTGGKYYRIRSGSTASGAILYETNSAGTTTTLTADPVSFRMPGSLYFQTDDTGPLKSIILYTE